LRVLFFFQALGTVAIMALFAVASPAAFISKFDSYSTAIGTTYSGLMEAAGAAGWTAQHNPMVAFAALPLCILLYGGFACAVYLGGEIKRAERSLFISIGASLLLGLVMWAGSAYLLTYSAGSDFVSALAYLSFAHPEANPLKVPATVPAIVSILSMDNPILYWFIFVSYIGANITFAIACVLQLSRIFFAWSFDRVVPTFMADVNDRLHSPIKAIVITFILGEIFAIIWAVYPLPLLMTNLTIASVTTYVIMGVAAIVFPFRMRSVFEASPRISRLRVAGFPVVTISGLVTTILMIAALIYSYLTPSFSGPTSPAVLAGTASIFLSGLVVFYIGKAYRRREGMDFDLAFKEIPPE
jgi:APA family basic amino acid/polyamine antiporter